MNTLSRDSQKSMLYAAEHQVRLMLDRADAAEASHGPAGRRAEVGGSQIVLPVERKFGDLASVQRYVDAVLAMPSVQQRWAAAAQPIKVRHRNGVSRAEYFADTHTIAIPSTQRAGRFAMRETYVLHEISHHLIPAYLPDHGPEFAEAFIELTECVLGAEAAYVLRICFYDAGVKIG